MSTILRIGGRDLDVDALLAAIPLVPTAVYRRGEPRARNRPEGRRNERSGANFVVSEAGFRDFPTQIADALAFLDQHEQALRTITNWPGLDEAAELDFGIASRDVAMQSDTFPAALAHAAGRLGLDLTLSLYPLDEAGYDDTSSSSVSGGGEG